MCVKWIIFSGHFDEVAKMWKKNAKLFMLVLSNQNFKISLKKTSDD